MIYHSPINILHTNTYLKINIIVQNYKLVYPKINRNILEHISKSDFCC